MPTQVNSVTDSDIFPPLDLRESLLLQAEGLGSLSSAQVQQLSPVALAYLGDAVYELFIRRYYLFPPQRIQSYHQRVVGQVRAESQAKQLQTLIPHLTPAELDWLKRGRNAATGRPRRVDADVYQQATSLETLVGYLYLTDLHRLIHLLHLLNLAPTPANQV